MITLVAIPVKEHFEARRDDSFPFSSYPMFANPRPEYEDIVHAYGLTPDGKRHVLRYRYWTTGGMHDGRAHLRAGVRKRADRKPFCEKIAAELGRRGSTRDGQPLVEVQIVHSQWSRDDFFGKRSWEPHKEEMVVRCPVKPPEGEAAGDAPPADEPPSDDAPATPEPAGGEDATP